jgi:hypothetical protein
LKATGLTRLARLPIRRSIAGRYSSPVTAARQVVFHCSWQGAKRKSSTGGTARAVEGVVVRGRGLKEPVPGNRSYGV